MEQLLKDEEIITITNRNFSATGYFIPELNRSRSFGAGMSKKITMGELRALSQAPGGYALIKNYFIIHNDAALEEILGDVEPEYHYRKEDVDKLLVQGSLAQVQDALDWAPEGVIEIMKNRAVDLKLPDRDKCKAITDKTGFDIEAAIRNKAAYADEEEVKPVEKKRRTTALQAEETLKPKRQAAPLEVSKEIPEVIEEESDEQPINKYSIG